MVFIASESDWLSYVEKGEIKTVKLGLQEILQFSSLLCSSDVIAAISMINYNDQPKLFSIIYGEGVFNDIVSIIMFNSVVAYFEKTPDSNIPAPIHIGYNFVKLGITSILIGVVLGIVSAFIFKNCRMLTHSASTETIILLMIAMITYNVSEALQQSGIISLLTTGIFMAQYTWYNLSP